MGPELIPVFRESASRRLVTNPAVACWLPLHSARPTVTFPAKVCHNRLAFTKLYYLVTEAEICKHGIIANKFARKTLLRRAIML